VRRWLGAPGRRSAQPDPTLPEAQLRTAWQAISLLLDYPGEELIGVLPELRDAVTRLPSPVGDPLVRLVDEIAATDVVGLRSDYVATFDTTRRCALHLSYYSYGDTRKRGIALVQFKQAYRRGGLEVTEDELPDHLSVVLEFGASADVGIAWKLLNDHRAGIEMLRLALADRGSRWLAAVDALSATLPPLRGDQEEAVATLLAEGPPNEDVGLDAYSLDPRLNPRPDADEAVFEGANR